MTKFEVMTPREVATLYRVTPRTVSKWCREGTLDAFKLGRVWRVRCLHGAPIHQEKNTGVVRGSV